MTPPSTRGAVPDAPLYEDFTGPSLDARLRWRCEPASWRIDPGTRSLRVSTDPKTDFWQRTHYGFEAEFAFLRFDPIRPA
jgi:uncharacterized protein